MRQEDMDALAVLVVFGRDAAMPIEDSGGSWSARRTVVARGDDLTSVCRMRGGAAGYLPENRLTAAEDNRPERGLFVAGPAAFGMGREIIQVLFRLRVDLLACLLEQTAARSSDNALRGPGR